jgi:electron transfer flavoprotein alpha subunit
MSEILVVAEHVNGALSDVTRELVTAARALGGRVIVGVTGADESVADLVASIDGVDLVVRVGAGSGGNHFEHERCASDVETLVDRVSPEVVLLAWSIRSASYAGGVAESLDLAFVADAIELSRTGGGPLVAVRPEYGGKVHAELEFAPGVAVMALLRPGVWAPAGDAPQSVPVEVLMPKPMDQQRVRHREFIAPGSGVDLTKGDVIFAVGRGVGSQENIAVFAELAQTMGALLGSSRPVVDVGWLPSAHQVGQTGVTVKPKVYVAFGISGAMQHVAGMKDSKLVVAVNTDPSAPIFAIADVGFNADIIEVAENMRELIQAQ